MADAAHAVLTRPSRECSGNFFLAEDVLVGEGARDLDRYLAVDGAEPAVDLYVDEVDPPGLG
jgi:citronellol/citronellal dehydrogenase